MESKSTPLLYAYLPAMLLLLTIGLDVFSEGLKKIYFCYHACLCPACDEKSHLDEKCHNLCGSPRLEPHT